MVSALGPDVVTGCAAARAGISRASGLTVLAFSQWKKYAEAPVVGHVAHFIGEGFAGTGKQYMLGMYALRDVIAQAALPAQAPGRLGLMVNFSDHYYETEAAKQEGQDTADDGRAQRLTALVERLVNRCDLPIARYHQKIYAGGHTGFVHALHSAIEAVSSGTLDRCLVGGIDSQVEPRSLEASVAVGMLKTEENPVGFMPGEAAAFLLIERLDTALMRRARIAGLLESPAWARDPHHRLAQEPPLGLGLTQAVSASLDGLDLRGCPIGLIVGDLNGDPYRASDWGYTLVRTLGPYGLGEVPLWVPASSFGDVGAATGPVAACVALRGFDRGYADAERVLLWLASDAGARAAFCLRHYRSR